MKRLNIKALYVALTLIMILASGHKASAQHTLTLVGGTGSTYARFYPYAETKWIWMADSYGISWRYYSDKPRFVGAVGIDLDYMERGYTYGYGYTSKIVNDKEIRTYEFYRRDYKSVMLPFVWQPHFYLAKNRLRVFVEAAFVLSYNFSSSYSYENDRKPGGIYEWKVPRDNRFGYGLSGGAGFAVLINQLEIGFKARYNFGYSDILKNRNKYYSNTTDLVNGDIGPNPFYYTPMRSPVDNLTFSITLGWRFNKQGFNEWFAERPQRTKRLEYFNFSSATNAASGGSGSSASRSGSGTSATSTSRPGGATTQTRPGGAPVTTKPTGAASAGSSSMGGASTIRR